MHTTMQTLGRVAIIFGGVLVAVVNVVVLTGTEALPRRADGGCVPLRLRARARDPADLDVGRALRRRDPPPRRAAGSPRAASPPSGSRRCSTRTRAARRSTGGSSAAGWSSRVVSVGVGVGELPLGQELVFASSLAIVLFLMRAAHRRARPGGAQHAGRHGGRDLRLPRRRPGPGPGATVVDDRPPGLRSRVLRASLADLERAHARRPLRLPHAHGRALDRLHRLAPHDRRHVPRAADPRHVLRAPRVDRRAHRRRRRRARHRARSTPPSSRRSGRSRWSRCSPGSRDSAPEQAEGDLLRGDGVVHEPRALRRRSSARST